MHRAAALLLLATLAAAPLAAQAQPAPPLRTDPALAATLDSIARGFRGDVGIYVRHLETGAGAEMGADTVFPTASLVKIPILLTLYERVGQGRLHLDSLLPYPDTLTYAYTEPSDVVGYMAPGDLLPLREIAFLMLTISDNHASLWLQAEVGGGAAVNAWLEANGYRHTRVNSRTEGREEARSLHGWGQTTPREIAEMLVSIREGRAVSPAASEEMYRMLSRTFWDRQALSQIPPTVQAASKQGFVDRARSEVLLVNSPGGDYVLAVATKNQADTSYTDDNEGYRLIREVSRAVYRHFNPGDGWVPRR